MKSSFKVILLFFLVPIVNAYGGERICHYNYIAFDDEHLSCLKKSPVINGVKANFMHFETLQKTCPKCADAFPDASKYSHLFKRDYLPLCMGLQGFGGYFVYILFRNDPMVYSLWLYEIDEGVFQLREFKTLEPHITIRNKMIELSNSHQYSQYWLNAFYQK